MKISIAMTTYNGEKYILEQLNSILNQTLQPNEIVICDDCSKDATLEIIKDFINLNKYNIRIRLFSNEINLGYTQNFAKAISLCDNELLFLCDQDDFWFPEKIEYMHNLILKHNNKDLFMCDAQLTNEKLKPSIYTKQSQLELLGLDIKNFVTGCCIAVRNDFAKKALPIPLEFKGHDNWLVNIADKLDKRYVDKKILQYYRRHDTNESHAKTSTVKSITKKDKLIFLGMRIKNKFNVKSWEEYFLRRKLLKRKINELRKN